MQMFFKTGVLKVASLRPVTLLKKETLVQVFFCEFCKIPNNTSFYRTPTVAASLNTKEELCLQTFWPVIFFEIY